MNKNGEYGRFSLGRIFLIAGSFALFLYSFTQVDLNLTLSRISLASSLQHYFQYIGYFNRPLSTAWYILVVFMLLGAYTLVYTKPSFSISQIKLLKKTIITVALLLTCSYPAFSYDIYNYMFDARIVTRYRENPYEHKALDYPQDPWINVMRWTHRTYPYGPVWLGLTVPLSFAGAGKFVPTLLLFKTLMTVSFVAACYFIYRIALLRKNDTAITAAVLFALNPLVIIESLVSSHNDIVMMSVSLLSVLLLFKKKFLFSVILLAVSVGIKFATAFLVPAYMYYFYIRYVRNQEPVMSRFFLIAGVGMACAVVAASIRTQFQPWYLLYVFPFMSLAANRTAFRLMSTLSLFGLFMYVPYLYRGDWNAPVPAMLRILEIGGLVCSVIVVAYTRFTPQKIR